MNAAAIAPTEAWPDGDLEVLGACPCCNSRAREIQVHGLRDFTMGTAPGKWTMWRCHSCRCAYLDPRPTPESIGRAYSDYHTHSGPVRLRARARKLAERAKFELVRRTLGLSSPRFANKVRHIAKANPGDHLLDVGFGAGAFLDVAKWLGFRAVGIDFDPEVVASAKARGHEVLQAGIPGSGLPQARFAHVTLSNVLEHLPDPPAALEEILRLLAPGGRLWLSQPNLGARGAKFYGRFWRGYEAPRHLTLWEPDDLMALLARHGFVDVRLLPVDPASHAHYYRESELQQRGVTPGRASPEDYEAAAQVAASTPQVADPDAAESLTIVAHRPA